METSVTVPRASRGYWIFQAAGWTAYLGYVLTFYFIFAPRPYHPADIVSIVFFCTVAPILLTHGLRTWMYAHEWRKLREWQRKTREGVAALVMGVVVTAAVGVANGVPRGRIWIPIDGMGWMLFAYVMAFGSWLWTYDAIYERRSRAALESLARDAQLRALRGQLNPHFLFNSLNAVRSLISENPQRAISMVTGISDILRYSLASDRRNTVPFADELAVIDEYIAVERERFESRLDMEKHIEASVLSALVPPMLVQTLVENAVKHGVATRPEGGFVRLEAVPRNGRVKIVVTNSGKFSPDPGNGGFGLQNATERLRLMYGSDASLVLKGDGDSTTAELTLPLETQA